MTSPLEQLTAETQAPPADVLAEEQDRVANEAAALLQQGLNVTTEHVTVEEARKIAGVQLECPDPRGQVAMSLGEFLLSGHAPDMADQIVTMTRRRLERGDSVDDALDSALGIAARRDENYSLIWGPVTTRDSDSNLALLKKN